MDKRGPLIPPHPGTLPRSSCSHDPSLLSVACNGPPGVLTVERTKRREEGHLNVELLLRSLRL